MSDKTSKRNNQKISVQTRKQLIKMVMEENTSVYKASKKVGIKNSTGKMILRKYRKTGQITQFKNQTQKIKIESPAMNQQPIIQNQNIQNQNGFCFEPQKQQCVITPIYFLTPPSNIYYSYVAPPSFSDMQQFHNINNSFYFN